jgi:tRNA pseudouridine38-40 synthase
MRDTAHHVPETLDIEAMKKGASYFIGTHDFKSFCSNKKMKKSSVRTVYDISFDYSEANSLLSITFRGNGFLYNMVRIMVGTLIEIGLHKRDTESITAALEGKDRALAGHTAPPNGLFLADVLYKE